MGGVLSQRGRLTLLLLQKQKNILSERWRWSPTILLP